MFAPNDPIADRAWPPGTNAHGPSYRGTRLARPAGSAGLVQAVKDNELDFAFAATPSDQAGDAEFVSLRSEGMILVCPPDHRLAGRKQVRLTELTEEPFIDVPPGWGSRASADRLFVSAGLPRRVDIAHRAVISAIDS